MLANDGFNAAAFQLVAAIDTPSVWRKMISPLPMGVIKAMSEMSIFLFLSFTEM